MNIDILNLEGKKVGSTDLPASLFGVEVRADLLQRAVTWQLTNLRGGLAHTKTRGEIARTKKKMYGQKGTGGARHGAKSPSLFVGGGVAHGPRKHEISSSLPKQVRQLALKTALSSKAADKNLIVVDSLALKSLKTKDLAASLAKLKISQATFLVDSLDANFDKASRNIPNLKVIPTGGANVYDILRFETLVMTPAAIEMLNARLSGDAKAEKASKPAAKKAAPAKKSTKAKSEE
ncbi:MAG TPA: 50S ribosomal protein L4 [Alphaproteobacteria bacterium]|nr:50S ribosomal protein L4 [Alphaproteobacteria bacterium]